MEAKHKVSEPPKEVWVVSDGGGQAEFVANFREGANDHANEAAEMLPEEGPYRLCKYVAEPFASGEPSAAEQDAFFAQIAAEEKRKLDAHDDLVSSALDVLEGLEGMTLPGAMPKRVEKLRAALSKATGSQA